MLSVGATGEVYDCEHQSVNVGGVKCAAAIVRLSTFVDSPQAGLHSTHG